MSGFQIGDNVRKVSGYPFEGRVVMVNPSEDKCSVKHRDGWEHIFSDRQLALNTGEYQYLDLLRECLDEGAYREGRNGGTFGLFGRQIRFDLSKGFPLLTTKKMFTKGIFAELLWFIAGQTDNAILTDQGVHIWDEWADENGRLGPIYGAQWRRWGEQVCPMCDGVVAGDDCAHCNGEGMVYVDQLQELLHGLMFDPHGRRHIISAWDPLAIPRMALPPCHCLFQFHVANGKLNCQLYQRSADIFLGVPFNIASYALLTHLVARHVGLEVGEFVHTFGDVHLYANHLSQAVEQLKRIPFTFPTLSLDGDADLFSTQLSDIKVDGYAYHPTIKAEVSK